MSDSIPNIELSVTGTKLDQNEALVHVSAKPVVGDEDSVKRKPCVLISILDVSYSMSSNASISTGSAEEQLFSRLDLVKHSMRTIINVLEPQDFLAIVPFSTNARVQLPLTAMDKNGKDSANKQLEALNPENATNIWDGLKVALELTNNPICQDQNVVLLLLTDGEPNHNPPGGIIKTLKEYIEKHPLSCTIHTFGFGYDLDSALLNDISTIGSGAYSYIPDCTMVGTIFVNFLSNVLSTVVNRSSFILEKLGDSKILGVLAYQDDITDKNVLNIGSIQSGQSRDIIVKISIPKDGKGPYFAATLKFGNFQVKKVLENLQTNDMNELYYQYSRVYMIEETLKAMASSTNGKKLDECLKMVKSAMAKIKELPSKNDPRVKALLLDMESKKEHEGGQVCRAFSNLQWYKKWGIHYIPSLCRAHLLQQCNNFKDPGVQVYGGKLFEELRDQADTIFCQLPPPKPSITSSGTSATSSLSNMSSYYVSGGVCFDGDGLVELENQSLKKVKDLVKGDRVKSNHGKVATVQCVIKTKISTGSTKIVELQGLKITPWHPVRIQGVWKFPDDIKPSCDMRCDYLYNLVLDTGHIVRINGVECVTLGHGFTENQVISHPYFGTGRVIDDLKKMDGWKQGIIHMDNASVVRDSTTGFVSSFTEIPTLSCNGCRGNDANMVSA